MIMVKLHFTQLHLVNPKAQKKNINPINNFGETPLHLAAFSGHLENSKYLKKNINPTGTPKFLHLPLLHFLDSPIVKIATISAEFSQQSQQLPQASTARMKRKKKPTPPTLLCSTISTYHLCSSSILSVLLQPNAAAACAAFKVIVSSWQKRTQSNDDHDV